MRQSSRPVPRRSPQGYDKGDDTRARLIAEGLRIFGERGYAAATTRELTSAAGAPLPSLSYYFGGKEGLYLACAEAIVERYEQASGDAATAARAELTGPLTPEAAGNHLTAIFHALARMLTSPGADQGMNFGREVQNSTGPAFELLYERLWHPGIELTAELITRASDGRLTGTAARVRALMLISSLSGFASGREIVVRAIDRDAAGEAVRTEVLAALDAQIDHLVHDRS